MATAHESSTISIESRAWRLTLMMVAALTLVRLIALFSTPLELYPDEAQYWLWSRELAFGYFSKPPMIAWLIWATTHVGGDAEAWVRLSAPLLHGMTALVVHRIARKLYGGWSGLVAAAIYSLMPGVVLSSGLMATDAPLLFFLSLTIWAYVALAEETAPRRYFVAAGMGVALGLAFLSKYAAVYALGSIVIHYAISKPARDRWCIAAAVLFVTAFVLTLAPNFAWNASHHFATVKHTASNANWNSHQLFNFRELIEFVGSQFGVFGPLPFAVLLGGSVWLGVKKKLQSPDLLLLCFCAPPLIIVAGEAFVSRANANWAGAAFVAGSVLSAGWLLRWNARRWLIAGLAFEALFAAFFVVCMVNPKAADAVGLSNGFKRVRGWDQTVRAIIERSREEQALRGPLSAVAMDDRFVYNAAAYYGRDYFGQPGAPPLRMWVHEAHPQNQAETEAPLDADYGRRALIVSLEGGYRPEIAQDFKATSGMQISRVRLDKKRSRRIDLFIAEGFAPLPRDPVTGLPPEPRKTAK
ncbi:glycosyltransferase family 39 protein [Caulobacter sp. FWC2]|uniref:ArnT family glycosyltransferase n=1 Tax=Caulobacter sp. FWC2 TaxID=69664 RepID=UPI000C1468F7|nr:glycosyltransferase family 39 protein [Caulobacter sp. FWC2]PIB94215.1 4-amino-4-deoxy-L-arabinose transferase [Caulobacter sp. FWC2]